MKKTVLKELLAKRGLKAELQKDETAGEVIIKPVKKARKKKEDK